MADEVPIEILIPEDRAHNPHRDVLFSAAAAALATIPPARLRRSLSRSERWRLCVAFVADKTMRRLNGAYRGKNKTTDVLSFSRLEGPPHPPLPGEDPEIGDVLLCLTVARRQATEYGATLREELARLTVHGVLHLFGYDHEIDELEARRMFRLQRLALVRWAEAELEANPPQEAKATATPESRPSGPRKRPSRKGTKSRPRSSPSRRRK